MEIFINGFISSLAQIMAIGMQGAWVLECGLKKQNIRKVVILCIICDVFLITFGIFGLGKFLEQYPLITQIFRFSAVIFLVCYSVNSFKKAISKNPYKILDIKNNGNKAVILKTLAVSLLNPHAWIDTSLIIGGLSLEYLHIEKYIFFLGCIFASAFWFILLGYSSGMCIKLFTKELTWRSFDFIIGISMLFIAYKLIY